MAAQASGEAVTGKLAGWLKGLVTTVLGLCSGAVLMYASPLIDRVVKPAKPVANFAAQLEGLQVTFQNRSTGGSEGWWDFGDGSALEPYVVGQTTLAHTYAKPGGYTAKLSLRNLLGDENERSVSVNLDGALPMAPAIESFTVMSMSPTPYAPATFRVVSKLKNADVCVWALGEDRPLEVSTDVAGNQERTVCFKHPGNHAIRLAVFNGKQVVEKSEIVRVAAPPAGSATAVLKVTRQAFQVITTDKQLVVPAQFPPHTRETVQPLSKEIAAADRGCMIKGVKVVSEVHATGVKAEVTPDGQKVRLTGQLVRPAGLLTALQAAPQAAITLLVKQEQVRPAVTQTPDMVTATVPVPVGSAALALPPMGPGWSLKQQVVSVELHDGERVAWQAVQLPATGTVVVQNRQCRVNAAQVGEQVRIDLTPLDTRAGLSQIGN
jgi:hypothetical protein